MPSPLSPEGRLLAGLERRRMPVRAFSDLAKSRGISNVSNTKLCDYFKDVGTIPPDDAKLVEELWTEIEDLARSFEPFVLDLRDHERVDFWLALRRAGKLGNWVFPSTGE